MDKKEKNKKKSRGKIAIPATILVVLGFLFGGRFGLNWGIGGNGGNGGNPTDITSNNFTNSNSTANQESVKPSLIIEVNEDQIIYDGKVVSINELRSVILEHNKSEYIWELQDNHAVKAPYDQVKSLLNECDATFAETESDKL